VDNIPEKNHAGVHPWKDDSEADIHSIVHALSHYMKAPITAILGFSSLLEGELACFENPDSAEKKKEITEVVHYTERITWNARLLEKMVDDLVFVSRLKKGRTVPVLMGRVCADVIQSHEHRLKERGISVIVQEDMPPAPVDTTHLQCLLTELLSNAISFSEPQSRIHIGFNNMEYFVRDGGSGIHPNVLERVFLPFFTTHGKNSMSTGTGLYTAKRITRLYGGNIRIESGQGRGTTVFFSFPG
jgi:signal transduction histidine kinase